MKKIHIFTEGGRKIGFGHITRCLALYQGFCEKGLKPVIVVSGDESLDGLLSGVRVLRFDWLKERREALALVRGADIAVIDSYKAGLDFYREAASVVPVPVYVDDNKRLDYPRGVIVNGNVHADSLGFRKKPHSKYLLGTEYALMRREFWKCPRHVYSGTVSSIMVTFGGTDADNRTCAVLRILSKLYPDAVKRVVVTGAMRYARSIDAERDSRTILEINPDAAGMKRIMVASDIAVSAGGQTTNELAAMGVPSVLFCVADNQRSIVAAWSRRGVCRSVVPDPGDTGTKGFTSVFGKVCADSMLRRNMGESGRRLVDGKGVLRTVDAVLEAAKTAQRPKRILFLTNNEVSRPLIEWLERERGESVSIMSGPLTRRAVRTYAPDVIISYNYRWIIPSDVISLAGGALYNLHISYLPWNRGAHPNIWSFIDDTPKGVTIHRIDAGLDTGPVVAQKKVRFRHDAATLSATYAQLHREIQGLFKRWWKRIRNGDVKGRDQRGSGSVHYVKDFKRIEHILGSDGWDIRVYEFKRKVKENGDQS